MLNLRQALHPTLLKTKLLRRDIEHFKKQAVKLFSINANESEEFHKTLLSHFLNEAYYKNKHYINIKETIDLAIRHENHAESDVAVIIEVKSPSNTTEMLSCDNLNKKALQELVLYYLRERITANNLQLTHLIVTNLDDWFIFDAQIFEKVFAENSQLKKDFLAFEQGTLAITKTKDFYQAIAAKVIAENIENLEFTYFKLTDYQHALKDADHEKDKALIPLFKFLSPAHLLKLSVENDNNSLNKEFYNELLYLLGLTENNLNGRKLIQRQAKKQRQKGSFLEQSINEIVSLDKLSQIHNLSEYGLNPEEQLFHLGLELSLTWINRILFLKLLEAQLITYHQGDKAFAFLNTAKISSFADLNSLFFQVLACQPEQRHEKLNALFAHVPYLNSSLFEQTPLERATIAISNLNNTHKLPIFAQTVLKNWQGKKRSGELDTLVYLFEFLDAYDFSSDSTEAIQEENKTLISASVLGLIFEKINGYQDGSFFTPSFITMRMSRETLRRAVMQKFNEFKGWHCQTLDEIYNQIKDRAEANQIVNSLKICDPAVGSGHFLVAVLNELIAIKSDLEILQNKQGRRVKHTISVVNDELLIRDEDGVTFEYKPNSPESQRVQETLFHEKQTLIENCLFGVDINRNSVQICRLRLWIELLKHAYYKEDGQQHRQLETLPNIDINIQAGNSLISRFSLELDLKNILLKNKLTIGEFKAAFFTYQNAKSRTEKRNAEQLIEKIKGNFRTEIYNTDPQVKRLKQLKAQQYILENQLSMFEDSAAEQITREQQIAQLTLEINQLSETIAAIQQHKMYRQAFEWRFEFPQVLNEEGDFIGFDVLISNPPYGVAYPNEYKGYFQNQYRSAKTIKGLQKGSLDTFSLFIELGFNLLKKQGDLNFIVPMAVTSSESMTGLHQLLEENCQTITVSSYSNRPKQIFDNACIRTSILAFAKNGVKNEHLLTTRMMRRKSQDKFNEFINNLEFVDSKSVKLSGRYPKISTPLELALLQKLFSNGKPLKQLYDANGKPIFYRTSGGRYFNVVTNYSTGSSKEKPIFVKTELATFVGAVLSSHLFYFYQQVYSNGLDLKQFEIKSFPVPNVPKEILVKIERVYLAYLKDIEKNCIIHPTSNYANINGFKEYKISKSKALIDKIDDLICPLYGFTVPEIAFIKNYEMEYRLGIEFEE